MSFLTVRLPSEGKILVTIGQKVSPGDPLVQGESFKRKNLNLARLLKVKPQKIRDLLVKKIGEEVKTGEVVARKSSLLNSLKLKSPVDGVLEKLDPQTGILTLKTLEDELLKSSTTGVVRKIKEGKEITIEVEGVEIEAKLGIGSKKEGILATLKITKVNLGDLTVDLADKIVAAKSWGLGSLSKAEALGIAAVLGEEFEDEDFLKVAQEKNLSSLGFQKRDFAILVFSSENFAKVLKYENCGAVVWGEGKRLVISNSQ